MAVGSSKSAQSSFTLRLFAERIVEVRPGDPAAHLQKILEVNTRV